MVVGHYGFIPALEGYDLALQLLLLRQRTWDDACRGVTLGELH